MYGHGDIPSGQSAIMQLISFILSRFWFFFFIVQLRLKELWGTRLRTRLTKICFELEIRGSLIKNVNSRIFKPKMFGKCSEFGNEMSALRCYKWIFQLRRKIWLYDWSSHMLNNYMLTIDHFLSFWSKKNKSSISFMVCYCNKELHF